MPESPSSLFWHFPRPARAAHPARPARIARAVVALLLVPATLLPIACTPQPFYQTEPFSRDRMGAVRRSAELTIGTLDSAAESTLQAFATAERLCLDPGESLEIAYATARGDQSAARGRQQSFTRRVEATRASGDAFFEEWRSEIRQFNDEKVAQASRDSLERVHTPFEALVRALEEVRGEFAPLMAPIEDRLLYLKHSRNEGPLAIRPAMTPEITDQLERIRQGVENARKAAAAFEAATASR